MTTFSPQRTHLRFYLVLVWTLAVTFLQSSVAVDRNRKKNELPIKKSIRFWARSNQGAAEAQSASLKPSHGVKGKASAVTRRFSSMFAKFPIPLSSLAFWGCSLGGIVYVRSHAMDIAQFIHEQWIETLLKIPQQSTGDKNIEVEVNLNQSPIQNATLNTTLTFESKASDPSSSFNGSLTFEIAEHVQNVAMMGQYLFGAHALSEFLRLLFDKPLLPQGILFKVSKASYTLYGAWQIQQNHRRKIVGHVVKRDPDESWGKVEVYDRFATIVLVLMTSLSVTDIFGIQLASTLAPFLALAGLGTTVLAFAAQDIAAQLIAGLTLATADKFEEGDLIEVQVGSEKMAGVVDDIGWLETSLRGADEVVLKLPNNIFSKAQLSNKSRNNNSRVAQTLFFSYDDMDKIPKLVQDIRQKLIENCPELISDGTRPFIVSWNGFQESFLEVVVDARFRIAPMGEACFENRQRVVESIAQAVKENDVLFAKATRRKAPSILSEVTEIRVSK